MFTASGGAAEDASRPLELVVETPKTADGSDDFVEILIRTTSASGMEVKYALELQGRSSTRHTGRTQLNGAVGSVLSRVRVPDDSEWCATLEVTPAEGAAYRLQQGRCA